ncbi:hypothetical protein G6O69_28615 [Pseudenhygromyxa sp. WMMC2535]|uniref:hypothetical protein n=1 Tax=Pseudenhygromyxa sp. WMMC2535 TaxID=2712867 RepID=UPI001595068E|nr:hypothetical protein [Pseudenhygromyxa sp. WMMC2535]NVB41830.1 hypothetical protein [Pseudenhygromyxa sp. WMMC2535]
MSVASNQRQERAWPAGRAEDSCGRWAVPEDDLASVARAFQNILERYSGTVMRRTVGTADEYGVDGLYVAVMVIRERTAWPAMRSEDRNALELASRLMHDFAMLPSTTYMQVPPADVDALVDRILTSVAHWARQQLLSHLKREYMGLLEEYAERLRPILEAARGGKVDDELVDRPSITIELMETFERWLASDCPLPARRGMLAVLEHLFG